MKNQENQYNELWEYIEGKKPAIEAVLREHLPSAPSHIETRFNEALEYALFPGGKRIRAVLTMLGAELVGGDAEEVLPAAAAVEFVQTASCIFDELPLMENLKGLRSRPPLHEKFDEQIAVLVGLGLLNAAYPLVFINHSGSPERAIEAHSEIVGCIGASGLIGRQHADAAIGAGAGDTGFFVSKGDLKTSAVLRLALRTGAILSGANYNELAGLSRFGELLGTAYQLGDGEIAFEENGKVNSDGSETSEADSFKLESVVEDAKQILVEEFDSTAARTCLIQLADFLTSGKNA